MPPYLLLFVGVVAIELANIRISLPFENGVATCRSFGLLILSSWRRVHGKTKQIYIYIYIYIGDEEEENNKEDQEDGGGAHTTSAKALRWQLQWLQWQQWQQWLQWQLQWLQWQQRQQEQWIELDYAVELAYIVCQICEGMRKGK